MFGMKCAHCGQLELAHIEDLEYHIEREYRFLPDVEYQEELLFHEIDQLVEQQEGYKYHLVECPGFEYPKNLPLRELAEAVAKSPGYIGFLPDELQERVRQEMARIEKEKEQSGRELFAPESAYMVYFGG